MKKQISMILVLCFIFCILCGCTSTDVPEAEAKSEDIVILFTNDIHCGIDKNITLSKVAAYKKYMKTWTDNVLLVDCGDAVQGSSIGTVSKGEISVDAMNAAGYDYAIFGNHEFDYGQERLIELVSKAEAQYLCCNITYSGAKATPLSQTKPYDIVKFGDKSVALIGVTTPSAVIDSAMTYFMEDDKFVYDFCGGLDGTALAACVQRTVDEARSNGADYVVVLAHLGYNVDGSAFNSDSLIEATTGIDAVLDGHSHETYTKVCIENKNGQPVLLAQTGTELSNLGQLVITDDGLITVTLIDELKQDDTDVAEKIKGLTAEYEELFNTVVAASPFELSIKDADGVRTVRNRETDIGHLTADAYRLLTGADISYVNGGCIRASLPAGDITYQNIMDVHPFGNLLCVVEVTGKEIADMLEYFVRAVQPKSVAEDKTAIGEDGSFPNMSGITFTVDTRIESPVIVDETDTLTGIDATKTRRVSDIKILHGDTYEPLDLTKTYTLASHNYMIQKGGCGMKQLLANHTLTQNCSIPEAEVLLNYIVDFLGGDLSAYKNTENRINFLR